MSSVSLSQRWRRTFWTSPIKHVNFSREFDAFNAYAKNGFFLILHGIVSTHASLIDILVHARYTIHFRWILCKNYRNRSTFAKVVAKKLLPGFYEPPYTIQSRRTRGACGTAAYRTCIPRSKLSQWSWINLIRDKTPSRSPVVRVMPSVAEQKY